MSDHDIVYNAGRSAGIDDGIAMTTLAFRIAMDYYPTDAPIDSLSLSDETVKTIRRAVITFGDFCRKEGVKAEKERAIKKAASIEDANAEK